MVFQEWLDMDIECASSGYKLISWQLHCWSWKKYLDTPNQLLHLYGAIIVNQGIVNGVSSMTVTVSSLHWWNHVDWSIWNSAPLSTLSQCVQNLVCTTKGMIQCWANTCCIHILYYNSLSYTITCKHTYTHCGKTSRDKRREQEGQEQVATPSYYYTGQSICAVFSVYNKITTVPTMQYWANTCCIYLYEKLILLSHTHTHTHLHT